MASTPHPTGRSTAAKISAILLAFAGGGRRTLTGIAHLTGLPLSTTRRLVTALVDAGILDRSAHGDYRAGRRLRALGHDPWTAGLALPAALSGAPMPRSAVAPRAPAWDHCLRQRR